MNHIFHERRAVPGNLLHQTLGNKRDEPMVDITRQRAVHQLFDRLISLHGELLIQRSRGQRSGSASVGTEMRRDGVAVLNRSERLLDLMIADERGGAVRLVGVEEGREPAGQQLVLEDDSEMVDGEESARQQLHVGMRHGRGRRLQIVQSGLASRRGPFGLGLGRAVIGGVGAVGAVLRGRVGRSGRQREG